TGTADANGVGGVLSRRSDRGASTRSDPVEGRRLRRNRRERGEAVVALRRDPPDAGFLRRRTGTPGERWGGRPDPFGFRPGISQRAASSRAAVHCAFPRPCPPEAAGEA